MKFAGVLFSLWVTIPHASGIIRLHDSRRANFGSSKGNVLKGHVISTHVVTSSMECTFHCTASDQCLSYNYKLKRAGDEGVCELNNATRTTNPAVFQVDNEYIHYFDKEIEASRTCLDHLRHGATEDGLYLITNTSGISFQVWCDLTSEPGSAWTLVLSFAFRNRFEAAFCRRSLGADVPINENSLNWEAYRLSLGRMRYLSNQSTHWRATTAFKEQGVDYTDYVRGNISNVDILRDTSLLPLACSEVEYINIRGHNASSAKVSLHQIDYFHIIHIDSSLTNCPFQKAVTGSVLFENNFGFYCEIIAQINPDFKGTKNAASTTEWWYGGYL